MPPDILLQELTASGLTITNAAWTESGENNVSQALNISMQTRGVDLTRYVEDNPSIESATLESHQQIVKLHEAVGNTILLHKYRQYFSLPTKEGRFDWTLSEEVQSLRDEYKADYALFVFMRDTFSSGSRVALMVAMAILGVPVSGGAIKSASRPSWT